MNLIINGEKRAVEGAATVGALLERLEVAPVRVAVEVNEMLVRRGEFDQSELREGDRVEIVTLVGGG